jgi:hypothetical protein
MVVSGLLRFPSGMVPEYESALLFRFSERVFPLCRIQPVHIIQKQGIGMTRRHFPGYFPALYEQNAQFFCFISSQLIWPVQVRINIRLKWLILDVIRYGNYIQPLLPGFNNP